MENPGAAWWIASLRAFRVSRSRRGESGRGKPTRATSGLIPFALLEKSVPNGCYWKTLQTCFGGLSSTGVPHILDESSVTWPASGMWDDGAAYRLPLLEPSTNGNGCGLLPTPVARDGRSFYVVTLKTAKKRIGEKRHQLHWAMYGIVYHGWSKGWANPRFSEAMMGWPIGWTALRPLERGRFQQWLRERGVRWPEHPEASALTIGEDSKARS